MVQNGTEWYVSEKTRLSLKTSHFVSFRITSSHFLGSSRVFDDASPSAFPFHFFSESPPRTRPSECEGVIGINGEGGAATTRSISSCEVNNVCNSLVQMVQNCARGKTWNRAQICTICTILHNRAPFSGLQRASVHHDAPSCTIAVVHATKVRFRHQIRRSNDVLASPTESASMRDSRHVEKDFDSHGWTDTVLIVN